MNGQNKIQLPPPMLKSGTSLEEAIARRRSVRRYKDLPLSLQEVSQMLWAAAGMTADSVSSASRSYPSAGGIYPQQVYIVAANIEGCLPGLYRYDYTGHSLILIKKEDIRNDLAEACFGQSCVLEAPMSIIFASEPSRAASRYGERGKLRYMPMDIGHAGQNVYLQAESLGLGTVAVGAFNDGQVKAVLGIEEEPLYIMPVGKR